MIKIGNVQLGAIPRVVLGVSGNLPTLGAATTVGVNILEVRIDQFKLRAPADITQEIKAIRQHGLPLIGTIRSKQEGGKVAISDSVRAEMYKKISPLVDAMDIELGAVSVTEKVAEAVHRNNNTLIVSYHNFSKTPQDRELEQKVEQAVSLGAHIIKIATAANEEEDIVRMFQFTQRHRAKNLVTIALGSRGSISRLLFPLAGSLMTYTSVSPAYGQIPLAKLVEDLRFYYPKFNEELIIRSKTLQYA